MKKSLKIFFILITSLPALGMELESNLLSLENMPQDIQDEIAQYLPFKGVESDTKLKEVLQKKCEQKKCATIDRKKSSIEDFKTSPNNRFILALKKLDNEIINKPDYKGLYIIDLKTKEKKFIRLPTGFDLSRLITMDNPLESQETIYLVNKGYYCEIAISNDKEIAWSDPTGVYLLTENPSSNNTKVIPLQKFDIEHVTDIKSAEKKKHEQKVNALEFNQQGTKLGIRSKLKVTLLKLNPGISMLSTKLLPQEAIELLSLPGKKEPEKTLQKYFRENLIKNKLEYGTQQVLVPALKYNLALKI